MSGSAWDEWAEDYDSDVAPLDENSPMVRAIIKLVGAGTKILEFGIGTGRVAIPLLASGFQVAGIDSSHQMLERLKLKIGDHIVPIIEGSFLTARAPGLYDAVIIVFNTLLCALTQDDQIATLENAARHLGPGGSLIIEMQSAMGNVRGISHPVSVGTRDITEDHVGFMVSDHDVLGQVIRTRHLVVRNGLTQVLASDCRYIWPSELLLMSRLTGYEFVGCWGSWDFQPFDEFSPSFIAQLRIPPSHDSSPASIGT